LQSADGRVTSAPRAGAEFEAAFVDELTRMLESEGCTGSLLTSFTSTQFTSFTSTQFTSFTSTQFTSFTSTACASSMN
jgi:hypothetical protein